MVSIAALCWSGKLHDGHQYNIAETRNLEVAIQAMNRGCGCKSRIEDKDTLVVKVWWSLSASWSGKKGWVP